jgi:hypothetical protein
VAILNCLGVNVNLWSRGDRKFVLLMHKRDYACICQCKYERVVQRGKQF